jgi:hypothetical protein
MIKPVHQARFSIGMGDIFLALVIFADLLRGRDILSENETAIAAFTQLIFLFGQHEILCFHPGGDICRLTERAGVIMIDHGIYFDLQRYIITEY